MNKEKLLKFGSASFIIIYLCILALRSVYTDSPQAITNIALFDVFSPVKSLILTAILLLAILAAYAISVYSKSFKYKYTGIEIGLALFLIGGFISISLATDQRNAITMLFTLAIPIAAAVVLTQLLNKKLIHLCLVVLIGLAMVNFIQCIEQSLQSNNMLIEQYQQNPTEQLDRLGITEDSFEHFLYEHRLFSKDIKGYFTTGNSAGSFFILGLFAAIGLTANALKNKNKIDIILKIIITLTLTLGIIITKSNGARVGLLLSTILFVAYIFLGKFLSKYKTIIICLTILSFLAAVFLAICYGAKNGTLPGPNAMLVRWQYWVSSWEMFTDNLLGVGGGNFGEIYPRYKALAAFETIKDPHNFILSLLCQYGIIGFVGIFIAIAAVLVKSIYSKEQPLKIDDNKTNFAPPLILITAVIFLGRLILARVPLTSDINVAVYLILILYIVPAAIFIISTFLITTDKNSNTQDTNYIKPALFCGIAGFLVHNLIDFAIFEPAIWSALWLTLACLTATNDYKSSAKTSKLSKLIALPVSLLLFVLFVGFVFAPVAKSAIKTDQAYKIFGRAMRNDRLQWMKKDKFFKASQFEKVETLLIAAAEDDKLSDIAPSLKARMFLIGYQAKIGGKDFLDQALTASQKASNRNKKNFKHYETKMRICLELSKISDEKYWLNQAYTASQRCIERYAKAEVFFQRGQIAEKLGKNPRADYEMAAELEEDFQRQFKKMYPDRPIVSKLGQKRYEEAKQKSKN